MVGAAASVAEGAVLEVPEPYPPVARREQGGTEAEELISCVRVVTGDVETESVPGPFDSIGAVVLGHNVSVVHDTEMHVIRGWHVFPPIGNWPACPVACHAVSIVAHAAEQAVAVVKQ